MHYTNPRDIESSYVENDLGHTLYELVLAHKPKKIIEIGTLYGYSAIAMAMALDELGDGHITAYDLFENYEFKHATMDEVQRNLERYGVEQYVTLKKMDFGEWLKNPEEFDMLHIDVSNKGDTIDRLYDAVEGQIKKGALVFFEGGSEERDEVEWMIKFKQRQIASTHAPYKIINPAFPSISQLLLEK